MCQLGIQIIIILGAGLCVSLWLYWKRDRLLEVIRRSRDRFKTLVDLSPYGIALTAKEGNIISANRALAHLLGKDVREMIGMSLPGLLGLDIDHVLQKASSLEAGEILKLPAIQKRRQGGEVLHLLPCLFRDEGNGDLLFWHVQDQTTYFELEKRFQELLESVPVGLFWADLQGRIGAVNPEFKTIFSDNQQPESLSDLLGPQGWKEARDTIIKEGSLFKTKICRKNGKATKHLKIELKSCNHGSAHYLAGIVKDVTVEHELQQELKVALEKAEAASRAKSTFLSQMSHEFRTPLNVIQGMATLLEDKITNQHALELVEDLKKAAEHLTSLIGDILDLAKIESGKFALQERPFDLKGLIEDIEGVLGVQAGLKDLEFRVRFPEKVHRYYMGDPVRIRQIIFNLAGNAIKLTQTGSVEVSVSCLEETADKKRLAIEVSDTGPGIPEDVLSNLFSPFVQAEEGRKAGGTGLGLSIAKEFAEMMNGSIKVESTVGEGSVFTVVLELKPVDSALVPKKVSDADLDVEPGLALVADDVPMNRKVLRMFLEKRGWQVQEASNGKEVLGLLEREGTFDVVLMDVSMPEMDGVEAAKRMKEHHVWRRIPVIAVTAHAMVEDRQRFLRAGMDGYVSKPVKPNELMKEMARLLPEGGGRSGKREAEPASGQRMPECQKSSEHAVQSGGSERADKSPVDYQKLLETCQGMEELARELLTDLVKECSKWMENAERAVKASDAKEIRRICHLMRGSASTVHAEDLSRTAEDLGKAAREGKEGLYEERLNALKQAASELERWVKANICLKDALDSLKGLTRDISSLNEKRLRA